ncbi:MAG: STAS domain-containing protein [Desulfococcaceae bacterium]
MQVQGDKYSITYQSETETVRCAGFLDLRGKDGYKDIADLLDKVAARSPSPEKIILDVKDLEFLNSSGITTIGGFVIKLRKKEGIRLLIQCANKHSWQSRSMTGLQTLMPGSLEITFE